jgi:hypothetical protein
MKFTIITFIEMGMSILSKIFNFRLIVKILFKNGVKIPGGEIEFEIF